jgi:hypothetical protein
VPVGWKGAHHSGPSAVREDDDGWMTTTARTEGRQRRFEGHRSARHTGVAPGGVGEPGDSRRWAAVGGVLWRNGDGGELVMGAWRSSQGRPW